MTFSFAPAVIQITSSIMFHIFSLLKPVFIMRIGIIWTDYHHEYKDFEFRRVSPKMTLRRAKADDSESFY